MPPYAIELHNTCFPMLFPHRPFPYYSRSAVFMPPSTVSSALTPSSLARDLRLRSYSYLLTMCNLWSVSAICQWQVCIATSPKSSRWLKWLKYTTTRSLAIAISFSDTAWTLRSSGHRRCSDGQRTRPCKALASSAALQLCVARPSRAVRKPAWLIVP